jgi:ABC-type sulfate/molybdate transport systems ATPase subunit
MMETDLVIDVSFDQDQAYEEYHQVMNMNQGYIKKGEPLAAAICIGEARQIANVAGHMSG